MPTPASESLSDYGPAVLHASGFLEKGGKVEQGGGGGNGVANSDVARGKHQDTVTSNANATGMASSQQNLNRHGPGSVGATDRRGDDDRRGHLNASYVFPAPMSGARPQDGGSAGVVKEGNMLRLEALVAVATREERVGSAF